MIQRIQTVYIGVSLILCLLLYYFPFYKIAGVGTLIVSASEHIYLLPTAAVAVVLHIVCIVLFNRRPLQARTCLITIVVMLLYVAFGIAAAAQEDQVGLELSHFRLGAVLPVISIILLWLARVNILKDEALVKSMDRLR